MGLDLTSIGSLLPLKGGRVKPPAITIVLPLLFVAGLNLHTAGGRHVGLYVKGFEGISSMRRSPLLYWGAPSESARRMASWSSGNPLLVAVPSALACGVVGMPSGTGGLSKSTLGIGRSV